MSITKHLAWPETRVGYLLTWIDREVPGWDNARLTQLYYDWIAKADDLEAHY